MATDEDNILDAGLNLSLGYQSINRALKNEDHHQHLKKSASIEPSLTLGFSNETFAGAEGLARQSSTLTTLSSPSDASPLGVKRERSEVAELERILSRSQGDAAGDDEDDGAARKKLRLKKQQSALLEDIFKEHNTLNPKQKQTLAKQLNLRPRQVEVWFQNRRARTKLKQNEVDLEILKAYCENLSDQNRRLKKELHELRALRITVPSPPSLSVQLRAAAVQICPSCKRIAGARAS